MPRDNSLIEAADRFRRMYILRTLEKHDWNVTHAAEEMGVERSYLYQLIERYGLRRPK